MICTALTLIFIWGNSFLPSDVSSGESGFVMKLLTPLLEIFTGKGNVTEHLVRKLAHFTEYTVLGVELGLLFGVMKRNKDRIVWRCWPLIFLHSIGIALIDETIQIFTGRGPAITDVWIDTAGATLGSSVVLLIIFLGNISSKRK